MTLLVHNFGARLRAILSLESWDYCVIWRLSEDQRILEWVDCCCAGAENIHNGEEPLLFPVSCALACKDVVIQHPRTNSCDLLTDLPSIVPLGSGIHAQALMSNQATWINFSPNLDSAASADRPNYNQETIGTRVLIPIPGGLVEFFVAKQVPEDPQVIEFITAQCCITLEQQSMFHSNPINSRVNLDEFHDDAPSVETDQNDPPDGFNFTVKDNVDMARHVSIDPGPLCHSSTIFSQHHHNHASDCPGAGSKNSGMFFQGTHHELNPFKPSTESGGTRGDTNLSQKRMTGHQGNPFMHTIEPLEEDKDDNDSFKGRSNSMSDSDANEDDEDPKYRRRTGKGTQCKNLEAERKRRKKLQERLYTLRSMVPKISKLDRASIIGDAIEFVKDLRKQVNDLQNELEERSDDEDQSNTETSKNQQDKYQQNGMNFGYKYEREKFSSRYHKGIAGNGGMDGPKQNQESQNIVDRVQQMEPQVEVAQLDGNEFFIRVFCEHKPGGFLRLMQALDSLGLEASSVNATRHTCLVSNIFKVERKDHEMLQADHVRDSLLELTRNPPQRVDWDD